MRVGIATVQVPFVSGGAEAHARTLRAALRANGHESAIVTMPFTWFPADRLRPAIVAAELMGAALERFDRVIGLKFPAYLAPHRDRVSWVLHQHRSAYDLWDHPLGDLHHQPHGIAVRDAVRAADRRGLAGVRRVWANSQRVADRLAAFSGVEATPLYHPPPGAELFRGERSDGFFLLPGRINPAKRQHLVAAALARTDRAVRVVAIGPTDDADYADALARLADALGPDRLVLRGPVDEPTKHALYARALAVLYPPVDEDYGYVSLEAMLSGKPVITCADSGGALEFVRDGDTGLVVPPVAEAVADAMAALVGDPARAGALGAAGRERLRAMDITWERAVACLLG